MTTLTTQADGRIATPFTILVDTAEKAPWTFAGLRARSFVDRELRLYDVRTERRFLGVGRGDYSLAGLELRVGIERKSAADFQGTLLGWPKDLERVEADGRGELDRRARFKRELATLAEMDCRAVVVEATLNECLDTLPAWGKRTPGENAVYLWSTYLAWSQEFAVPWYFADGREMAARLAFRVLEKFWSRVQKERRRK